MLRTVLSFFFTAFIFAYGVDTVSGDERKWVAPDGSMTAVAEDFTRTGDEAYSNWDVVTFRDHHHSQVASISLKEGSGVSRAGVTEGIWSADSRFFCFQTASSGGHSAWHVPTYVFDARKGRIYSIDDTIGPVTSDNSRLHFVRGDVLHIDLWNVKWEKDSDPSFSARDLDLPTFTEQAKVALHSNSVKK